MLPPSVFAYLTLLRLPYQLQLGPIFAWGYLLAGGSIQSTSEIAWFLFVFFAFHIGAFGGLTALNSYYDRDTGPIGGLWQPPAPPKHLWHFAWLLQLIGLATLLPYDWRLAAIYGTIVLLALGYSHPRTRWKGHPLKSVAIVAVGQGVLDCGAGALTAPAIVNVSVLLTGLTGATITVIAFYPLTQLYQLVDDARRGDRTTAGWLMHRFGRRGAIRLTAAGLALGGSLNGVALMLSRQPTDASMLVLANLFVAALVWNWSRDADVTEASDFKRVHRLMRVTAVLFGVYIVGRLGIGGL